MTNDHVHSGMRAALDIVAPPAAANRAIADLTRFFVRYRRTFDSEAVDDLVEALAKALDVNIGAPGDEIEMAIRAKLREVL